MTGPDVRDCCNNVICPIDDGALTGTIAFQADRDTCVGGDRQWRLERTFDTTRLTDMRLCFDYADRQAGGHNDTIQVEIDDGTDFAVLFCDDEGPRDNVDDQFYRYCFDLPAWAAGNPALEVRFFLHSNDNNNRIFLDNISRTGWGGGCLKDIYEVFYDDLDDGTGSCDLSEWVISGTYHNCPGFDCNNEPGWSPGIDVDKNDTLFMETTISTLQLDGEVAVCFGLANDGANNGNLVALEYDVGAGPLLAWSQQGRLGPDKDCREICVDLSEIDPAVNNNPSLGLTFTMHSADKKIALYYVRVTGARYCEATNSEVSLSSIVGAGGGDYAFSATDTWGDQLTAQISCEWEPDPTIYVDRQSVWYRPLRLNPSNINEPVEQLLCVNSFDWTTTGAVTMNTDTGAVSGLAAGEIVFNVVPQGGGAPDLGVFSFHDIDIRHDVTVVGDNALVLLSCTDINIDGAINASGTSGVMNVSGACSGGFGGPGGFNGGNCLSSFPPHDGQGPGGGGVGAQAPCNWLVESGGAGASFGGTGGHGGDGDDGGGCSIAGPVPAVPYGTLELIPLIGGSGGGTGGDNYGGPGGGGGGAVQLSANGSITVGASGLIWAGGGGGAGGHDGGDSGAGGGAGSGGAILLEADTVSVDGTMAVNGGGGGAGFNGNPGWGSGIGASGQPGTSDESCALGGIATGSGGGNGGDGSCGDVTSGAPGGIAENGGGGGGAAGRIRVNTRSGSMSGSGVFSPSVSSGLVTEGFIETW